MRALLAHISKAYLSKAMRCASLRFRKLSTVQEIRNKFRSFGEGTIKTTIIEDICVINMQHIKKRNAFTGKMMAELNDTIEFLETWKEGSFVIIKGAGNTFCSGADLKDAAVNLKTPLLGTEVKKCYILTSTLLSFFCCLYTYKYKSYFCILKS